MQPRPSDTYVSSDSPRGARPVAAPLDASAPEPPVRESMPWRRWGAIAALCLVVFLVALWQSSHDLHTSPFHPDESRWVNRAAYLEELRHPLSSFWQDRYLVRAQPPFGSYMIGLGLMLQGQDLATNGPWDFQYGFENAITWNVSHGNMPTFDNLIAARQWNMVLGALTCVFLVLIVGMMVNWVGGAIAGLTMAIHPLHIYLSTLAVSDAMFTTFVAFAVFSAVLLARKPTWARSVLLAVALGMGAATKLSPLFIAAGWSGYALILFLDPWLRSRARLGRFWSLLSRKELGTERRLGWRLLAQVGLVGTFFILVYPFLWPDPIGRIRIIFAFRRYEMNNQAGFWPQAAIHGPIEALERTWQNLQDRTSSSERIFIWLGELISRDWSGYSVDLYLAVPGLAVLLYLAWKNGLASPQMLGMIAIVAQSILILGALGVDFNRYYEPLVFTTAAGVGVLGGWLVELIWGVAWFSSRRRASNSAVISQSTTGGTRPV
ncbi:MAG: phospholipid carrier-dependent glycosyltransferase [Thermomicrobiales bacterium]|nr:phospholipid carrier-dependent glycosyltransferase [Thermomicrobiales bacterium]